MLLRKRQKELVTKSVTALREHQNTLAVAPTGSGKTIMLSSVIGQMYRNPIHKACVLAHRDELTSQNEVKFKRVNPHISTSIYDASNKSWDGAVTFAMVQTLSRQSNLDTMPKLDALIIDEAHHAAANSYGRVIEQIKDNNPKVLIFGVTATPNRGDKKGLRPVFSNVADQITVKELIQSGHLVKPRTMVMDLGLQNDLRNVRKTMSDFDMNAVADIMNRRPINDAVVKHWRDHAGDRQTVIFCSTVQHAHDVCEAFTSSGYKAATIWGDMSDADRRNTLSDFTSGKLQILVNVSVLTEGFDHPPTSCVILLRPSSFKSTMIQMIGRGLRIVDPKEHPDIIKKDCIILDFGTSTLIHGSLEDEANLDGRAGNNEAPYKECPDCGADVPISVRECALCGYEWPTREPEEAMPVSDFVMSEIDLLKRSNFEWIDIKNNGACYMASGFEAWGCVLFKNGDWVAVGGHKRQPAHPLARGDKQICLAAADDWLNSHETESAAHKTRGWLNQSPTDKQMQYLPDYQHDYSLTRYKASVLMTAKFNRNAILKAVRT